VLLARAAAYAKHRDNYSALFNIETMEPLVAGPPFVQALEELVATAKSGPADPFHYDPSKARAAFWRGECGIMLSWPTAADQGRREKGEGGSGKGAGRFSDQHVNLAIPRRFLRTPRLAACLQPQHRCMGR
jgi:ABC-type glycerol-3-phosphate transport system substrate-binding protein